MMKKMMVMAGLCIGIGITGIGFAGSMPKALEDLDQTRVKVLDSPQAQTIQGTGWSPNGFSKGQCTWWTDGRANENGWRLKFAQSYGRDASKWWSLVTNAGQSQYGLKGNIMVLAPWQGNSYGHVGVVESSVKADSSWKVSHANWNAGSAYRTVEGVQIRLASVSKVSPGRVSFGGASSYPLRGFLYKKS